MATAKTKAAVDGGKLDHAKDPWRAYLRKKQLKTTQQREAIVDAFLESRGHVTLDELLVEARARNSGVGLATVYRTLKLLEDAGMVHVRQFGPDKTLYELADEHGHHDHIICQECHHIVEFESDEIEAIQDKIARRQGFHIISHKHELFGLCDKARGVEGGTCPAESAGRDKRGGHRTSSR